MRVLVTGPFGNIGARAVSELMKQEEKVRCFARPSRANRRAAARFGGRIELVWGDIRDPADVARAVAGQDAIVHLAFVIPPASEDHPGPAEAVNIGGTRNVIAAAQALPHPPRLLFASSFAVFGHTQDQPPPRRVTDPVEATDHYTRHKIACEEIVRASGLEWAILRFADVPPLGLRMPHPIMFRIPLETRFEALHPADAGLALANAIACEDIWGRVWLIGGGPRCQMRYRDYLAAMLDLMGVGMLPERAFGTAPFYTDWLDSTESARLLAYQRHTFAEVMRDVGRSIRWLRTIARPLRPAIRWWLLRMSPYWRSRREPGITRCS